MLKDQGRWALSTQFRYGHNADRYKWCDGKIAIYLPRREASGGTSLSPAWNSDSQAPGWWEIIAFLCNPPSLWLAEDEDAVALLWQP